MIAIVAAAKGAIARPPRGRPNLFKTRREECPRDLFTLSRGTQARGARLEADEGVTTELLRRLRDEGATFVRQGHGSAQIFRGADGTTIVVHVHPAKEVPTGTAAAALKRARESRERAEKAEVEKKGQE